MSICSELFFLVSYPFLVCFAGCGYLFVGSCKREVTKRPLWVSYIGLGSIGTRVCTLVGQPVPKFSGKNLSYPRDIMVTCSFNLSFYMFILIIIFQSNSYPYLSIYNL